MHLPKLPDRASGTIRLPRFTLRRVRYSADTRWSRQDRGVGTLEIVVQGTTELRVGRRCYVLREGASFYAPPRAKWSLAPHDEVEVLSIETAEAVAREVMVEETARAWTLNLIREARDRGAGWPLILEGLILQGLGWFSRLDALGPRPKWLEQVVTLARKQQSLGAIARIVRHHPSHVAREFRRHQGVSVGEFARRCRLELAAGALASKRHSIAEVAFEAGFCDQSHFTRSFRRVFGVTPAAYRRANSRAS